MGKDSRLFSLRNSSTSWSRLMSSLFRLFRPRHGFPSRPTRSFLGLPSLSTSSSGWPSSRRRARSVSAMFLARASSPRSISISFPVIADCCATTGFPSTVVVDGPPDAGVCGLDPAVAAASAASRWRCRLVSSDSMYSSLPWSVTDHLNIHKAAASGMLTYAC